MGRRERVTDNERCLDTMLRNKCHCGDSASQRCLSFGLSSNPNHLDSAQADFLFHGFTSAEFRSILSSGTSCQRSYVRFCCCCCCCCLTCILQRAPPPPQFAVSLIAVFRFAFFHFVVRLCAFARLSFASIATR